MKPEKGWDFIPPPKVFIDPKDWTEVAQGLIERGICTPYPLSKVISIGSEPVLGGFFGVSKKGSGVEALRHIMDLRPVNKLFHSIVGDMETLPMLSQLQPLELYPEESLLISSEYIKAMFYVVGLGEAWRPLL